MIIVPIITINFHQVTCRQISEAIWSRALSTNWSCSRWRWPWGKFLIISFANIITSPFYHYPSEGGLLRFSIKEANCNAEMGQNINICLRGAWLKNTVFNPPFILTAINIINTLVYQYTWLRSGRHRDGHKLRALSHVAPRTCVAGKRSIRVNFQMDSRGRNRKKNVTNQL